MSYQSLGLSDRDQVNNSLGGGIPTGSLATLTGETATGKSVWASRLAYGMIEEGTTVSIVSTELTAREYIDQMNSLEYSITTPLLNGQLKYFYVPSHTTQDAVSRLLKPTTIWDADVVVIDEFGVFLQTDTRLSERFDRGAGADAVRKVLAGLETAQSDGTVVLTTLNPETLPDPAIHEIATTADIHLSIEKNRMGQSVARQLVVDRFQEMRRPIEDTIGFSVEQGRGIVIESRTIA
ncbi:MAG: putative ATPases involved in biogenesis of archaeal flagella [halophilic archaeon J07HX64]|jgi:Predicted ATPases involved in biogenesis of archaeal flagella|nr:MAG: putative ATPases involved in biogenesis of archaeal flagella [halophilic archaeon J07HX64]